MSLSTEDRGILLPLAFWAFIIPIVAEEYRPQAPSMSGFVLMATSNALKWSSVDIPVNSVIVISGYLAKTSLKPLARVAALGCMKGSVWYTTSPFIGLPLVSRTFSSSSPAIVALLHSIRNYGSIYISRKRRIQSNHRYISCFKRIKSSLDIGEVARSKDDSIHPFQYPLLNSLILEHPVGSSRR